MLRIETINPGRILIIGVEVDRWKAVGRKHRDVEQMSACAESPCIRKILRMITEIKNKYVPVEVTYSPKYHTASSDRERAEQIEGERQRSCVPAGNGSSGASSRFRTAAELDRGCTLMFIDSVVAPMLDPMDQLLSSSNAKSPIAPRRRGVTRPSGSTHAARA